MDELGQDYLHEIMQLRNRSEKWNRVRNCAAAYGFSGIQLNSKVYEQELGLDLLEIPAWCKDFRLSYHVGGVSPLVTAAELDQLHRQLQHSLEVSVKFGVEDVSFHPPLSATEGRGSRGLTMENLSRLIETWLPMFQAAGVTLSMESHVSIPFFVFHGLKEFRDFVKQFPELGALIDFSHNCYDRYGVEEILDLITGLKVTGLHLSDAQPGCDFREGTHLPIGRGVIDFTQVVKHFQGQDIYAALEVKGTSQDIAESADSLRGLADYGQKNLYQGRTL